MEEIASVELRDLRAKARSIPQQRLVVGLPVPEILADKLPA